MLALNRLASLALHFVIPAALLTGCVVKKVDSDDDHHNSSTNTSGSGTTGSGGSGGSGGGGQGGSGGGQGGSGGGETCSPSYPSCVGQTAQCAYDTDSCTRLNIAPEQGATQCVSEPMQQPLGYRLCNQAFTQFNPGAAEYLYTCLETIGVQYACDVEPVQTCINEVWTDACVSDTITQFCTDVLLPCGIEQAACGEDLKVFSDSGLDALVTCINDEADPQLSCPEAYDFCYTKAMTF